MLLFTFISQIIFLLPWRSNIIRLQVFCTLATTQNIKLIFLMNKIDKVVDDKHCGKDTMGKSTDVKGITLYNVLLYFFLFTYSMFIRIHHDCQVIKLFLYVNTGGVVVVSEANLGLLQHPRWSAL